ncbi:hypothetical protein ACRARG_04570 [Pseudooceanicola sp. C21-150M6]|uniref:hypothetical protein n=1 Tax=Pseudooceanicola sp. C21-150M6 TaxID=3434355 RepID=UPI003D7F2590
MKIIYEPHPVSPERKAELRAQGFKIIDARFAPDGEEPKALDVPESPEDIDAITDKEKLGEWLDAHGVEYDGRIGVEKRQELLKKAMFV